MVTIDGDGVGVLATGLSSSFFFSTTGKSIGFSIVCSVFEGSFGELAIPKNTISSSSEDSSSVLIRFCSSSSSANNRFAGEGNTSSFSLFSESV